MTGTRTPEQEFNDSRIIGWLSEQTEPRSLAAIARGAGCARQTARVRVDALARAGRLRTSGPAGSPLYELLDVPEVRVSIRKAGEAGWWEPETVTAGVFALRALSDARTLGTIGPDSRQRLRAAAKLLTDALDSYDTTGGAP